ncbi:hypothetical protein H8B13_18625 [Hymenobacter sp. BT188]|uniref:hypothetical protein n=1 Tax=Hymenobacter sp. BT188 TaxID=2763504 RepID=UPI00165148D1|nr:hypothetical protein [Hymenobacter sp. BT188]MBC6608845.1 hypothetical protein [Hymenobacter sp. BT188]
MRTCYPLAATCGPDAPPPDAPARLPSSARHQLWHARWDSTAWSKRSTGVNNTANARAQEGSGDEYAGGSCPAVGDGLAVRTYLGIYQDDMPFAILTALSASRGVARRLLSLTGTGLRGVTAVTFTSASTATNAPAGFVARATSIRGIVVPAGLAPGAYTVTVTTAGGTSNGLPFTVLVSAPTLSSSRPPTE